MKINGIVVNVNYSDLFAPAIDLWVGSMASLTIVTSESDRDATLQAWKAGNNVCAFRTDRFYRDGARFNKAAALNHAMGLCISGWVSDWILLIDADVVPPADWLARVVAANPQPGNLYGCRRQFDDGTLSPMGEIPGFFQLFHSSDPLAQRRPLFDERWGHAGAYDSEFGLRWGANRRWIPDLILRHHGQPGRNWCGRGNDAAMDKLIEHRAKNGNWAI